MPFVPGRTDASQEQTDAESFAVLEARGGRVPATTFTPERTLSPETLLLERAFMLRLDRSGDDGADRGHASPQRQRWPIPTRCLHRPARDVRPMTSSLSLLDMRTEWGRPEQRSTCTKESRPHLRAGHADRHGRRPRLRRACPAPRARGGLRIDRHRKEKFVRDFVAAWDKVMNLEFGSTWS